MTAIALVVLVVVGALILAHRRGHLVGAALAVVALAGGAFAVAFALTEADWRDADGFVDCRPDCSLVQRAVGTAFFGAPVAALIGAAALVASALSARRRPSP